MDRNFVIQKIIGVWKNIALTHLVVATCVGGLLFYKSNHIYNLVMGPFKVSADELTPSSKRWYIEVDTEDVIDPKMEAFEYRTVLKIQNHEIPANATTTKFLVADFKKKFLLIEAPIAYEVPVHNKTLNFVGCIDHFPWDEEKFPNFYPIRLNAMSQPKYSGWLYVIVGGFVLSINLYFISKSVYMMKNPKVDKAWVSLKEYGEPDSISAEIIKEWGDKTNIHKISDTSFITESYLIKMCHYETRFIKLDRIRWVYGKTTKTSSKSIPFMAEYVKMFWPKDGDEPQWDSHDVIVWTKTGSEGIVFYFDTVTTAVQLVQYISYKSDKVLFGYSNEIEYYWKSERDKLVALIEENFPMQQSTNPCNIDFGTVSMSKPKA